MEPGESSARNADSFTGPRSTRRDVSRFGVTVEEVELLIDGLSDDVAFEWVLNHLGLSPAHRQHEWRPSVRDVQVAFGSLAKLSSAGFVSVCHLEYVDGGSPGRVAAVRHLREPIKQVRKRVETACTTNDWQWSCWVVNTIRGDEVARAALGADNADAQA